MVRPISSPGDARPPLRLAVPADAPDDATLLARAGDGDERAFEVLVARYQDRVFSFCVRMLGDRSEAEDLAQDVFLTVYSSARDFRGESKFSTWLFRVAKNHALNRLKYLERRGRTLRSSIDELGEERLGLEAPGGAPDERLASGQLADLVQKAIQTLGDEQRMVVVLRDMEELSYEEISEITGLPPGTVKSRIHRGRSALASRLARWLK